MWTFVKMWLGNAANFLKPILTVFASSVGVILADAATKAVANVAQHYVLTGNAKKDDHARRDAAYDQIVADLAIKGVQASTQAIFMAIEAAVINLKTQK